MWSRTLDGVWLASDGLSVTRWAERQNRALLLPQ